LPSTRTDGEPLPDFPKERAAASGRTQRVRRSPLLFCQGRKGVCSHEHVPEEEGEGEKHESIWKRCAREAAEAEAGVVPEGVDVPAVPTE
jgi:hypothetical protein